MNLYLDIDGVLLDYSSGKIANYAIELIEYVVDEFDCYWLTTHCKGDETSAIYYLSKYFPPEIIKKLKKIKPTYWETLKTEVIDFHQKFVWLDDYPFQAELQVLEKFNATDSLYRVNLKKPDELKRVLKYLKEKNEE